MNNFEEYYKDFVKLEEEFQTNLKNYPLFSNIIDDMEKDIDEINELLEKNDLFYLKKAIDKLEYLNKYIKDTNSEINGIYDEYNKKSEEWSKVTVLATTSKETLDKANDNIYRANNLIKESDLAKIREALKLLSDALNLLK